jgi:hypothetical protein
VPSFLRFVPVGLRVSADRLQQALEANRLPSILDWADVPNAGTGYLTFADSDDILYLAVHDGVVSRIECSRDYSRGRASDAFGDRFIHALLSIDYQFQGEDEYEPDLSE